MTRWITLHTPGCSECENYYGVWFRACSEHRHPTPVKDRPSPPLLGTEWFAKRLCQSNKWDWRELAQRFQATWIEFAQENSANEHPEEGRA